MLVSGYVPGVVFYLLEPVLGAVVAELVFDPFVGEASTPKANPA